MALQLTENDEHFYQFVSDQNRGRQYDFLRAAVALGNAGAGLEIDHEFLQALNFYATQYISPQPGRYRRHYDVVVQDHKPSEWPLVLEEMDAFLEVLHEDWAAMDEIQAAAYALWGVNHIHPFCDGNGRTARALCYFVLCRKLGTWVRGKTTIMELIRTERHDDYCAILQRMHDAKRPDMRTDLAEMTAFLGDLVLKQIRTA